MSTVASRPVVGYLLQEAAMVAEPVVLEDTGEVLRFRAVLQDYGRNRNQREYSKDTLMQGHSAPRVQELLATRTMYGEQNHPFSKEAIRQIVVDMSKASHMNVNFSFGTSKLSGVVETLAWAHGPDLRKSIVINKSQTAFSMRGVGDVTNVNGTLKVSNLVVGAYDWVTFPSHKVAYIETTTTPLTESAYMAGLTRGEINSMRSHLSESANLNSIIDQFGLERPEIIITEGCNFATVQGQNGRKVLAAIENDISHDFRSFILKR